jgi:glycosyltransferase involved in cell wall biosynthesis
MCRGERVICVSETVRAHVLAQWPRTDPGRLTVIERGIDPATFSGAAATSAIAEPRFSGQKLLLMPGRGTRLKGHAAAISLLADLRNAGVNAGLWLLGAREPGREAYVAELENMAKSLGVADFMQVSAPRANVIEAYRQADLVLQLSAKPEAFGRTVVEALCVGKQVVGWSHGGVGELLDRYFPEGRVALGDQSALLATTLRLLGDARQPARIFPQTLATMQAQTLKVYESVAA